MDNAEQIQEYRDRMNQKLKENGLSSYVEGLSDALDETNRMLSGISEKNVMESATNVSEKINEYKNEQMTLPLSNFEFDDEDGYLHLLSRRMIMNLKDFSAYMTRKWE